MLSIPGFVLGKLLNRKVGESDGEGGKVLFLKRPIPTTRALSLLSSHQAASAATSFSGQRILLEGCSSEASKCPPLQAAMSDPWGGGGGSDF